MRILLFLAGAAAIGILAGCSSQNNARYLTPQQASIQQQANAIAQRTNGNWDSLTPTEKSYYIKTVGHGSEPMARMTLNILAGKGMPSKPGGAPAPGAIPPPGQAPASASTTKTPPKTL